MTHDYSLIEPADAVQETPPALAIALIKLKIKYIAQLGNTIAEMDVLCPPPAPAVLTLESLLKLTRIAHKLAGSGKTFDLPSISDAGHALEIILAQAIEETDNNSLSPATQAKVKTATATLNKTCRLAISNIEPESLPEVVFPSPEKTVNQPVVLIATGSDMTTSGQLKEQLQYLGFKIQLVGNIASLAKHKGNAPPLVIIIVTSFSQKDTSAIQAYLKTRDALEASSPILYLASQNTFGMRLAAVRLRGDAFLALPVDHLQLIDKLGTLAERSRPYHYHVLIVDDDEMLATRYGIALEKAGMLVTILNDPKRALEIMDTAAIDLVLMDFDMPDCNGYELASMLRQMDNYIRLPILFLSAQPNLDSRLRHAHLGIDAFLSKPVTVEQLVQAVSGRAARSSVLHKFINEDSATGLLNHTRLKKELVLEISRSTRENSRFTYALLDIDHFKMVNDTFGHAMGDVVIKTLAHLLRQRLRLTDIIGRYGGEEFGVVLLNANAQQALRILQKIHMQFSSIIFTANKQEFNVTFSGGIAAFPTFSTDATLSLAADEALYKAKHRGRNQLVVASLNS